jgi:hypothetical protein
MKRTDDSRTRLEYSISKNEDIGMAVVRAVSQFEDCSPLALPALQETIDVDSL